MEAQAFAQEWIEAWNAHDLERILSHYAEDVVLTSPRMRDVLGDASGVVRGKQALREYFARGLARLPDLYFALEGIYAGVDSVVVRFRSRDKRDVSELMVFDPHGFVREVRAHWSCDNAN